jgi:hypothetical protein
MMNYSAMGQLEWEAENYETDEFEFSDEWGQEQESGFESPFNEMDEMELASQLLEITDEAELDQFLGKIFKKIGRVAKGVIRPLGSALKGIAKKALPFVGGALGSFIPIPGVGTAVGSALGGALSKALEMELEGLDPEDQEFEMARRYVRLAGSAAQQAAAAPPGSNPNVVVRNALMTATRQQFPGIQLGGAVSGAATGAGQRRGHSGRWIRRGNRIILLGA